MFSLFDVKNSFILDARLFKRIDMFKWLFSAKSYILGSDRALKALIMSASVSMFIFMIFYIRGWDTLSSIFFVISVLLYALFYFSLSDWLLEDDGARINLLGTFAVIFAPGSFLLVIGNVCATTIVISFFEVFILLLLAREFFTNK